MCLRVNKSAEPAPRAEPGRYSGMREPNGYLGVIVRRLKAAEAAPVPGAAITARAEQGRAAIWRQDASHRHHE